MHYRKKKQKIGHDRKIIECSQSHGKLFARTTNFDDEGVLERLLSLLQTLARLNTGRLVLSNDPIGGEVVPHNAVSTAAKVDHSSLNDSSPALMCNSAICRARGIAAAAADDFCANIATTTQQALLICDINFKQRKTNKCIVQMNLEFHFLLHRPIKGRKQQRDCGSTRALSNMIRVQERAGGDESGRNTNKEPSLHTFNTPAKVVTFPTQTHGLPYQEPRQQNYRTAKCGQGSHSRLHFRDMQLLYHRIKKRSVQRIMRYNTIKSVSIRIQNMA
jgi:hypothetical protein